MISAPASHHSPIPLGSPLRYLWAFPNTVLGLAAAGVAAATGGRVAVVDGVLEVEGGAVRGLLEHALPLDGGASAMTLGHVVLARDADTLVRTRRHERAHVRQAERWGPLFIPAYAIASLVAVIGGGHHYLDNAFERAARLEESTAASA